jgi:hypothetical protein
MTQNTRYDAHSLQGLKLRDWMESQLLADIRQYGVTEAVTFDWSQSFGTGGGTRYLDGTLENFSRIILFDSAGNLVADGCIDYISNNFLTICYWDLITVWKDGHIRREKREQGIPAHIWKKLPGALMEKYVGKRI